MRQIVILVFSLLAGMAWAAEDCAGIKDDAERLACYDANGREPGASAPDPVDRSGWQIAGQGRDGQVFSLGLEPTVCFGRLPVLAVSCNDDDVLVRVESECRHNEPRMIDLGVAVAEFTPMIARAVVDPGGVWMGFVEPAQGRLVALTMGAVDIGNSGEGVARVHYTIRGERIEMLFSVDGFAQAVSEAGMGCGLDVLAQ
jgi:hypothetical protein